MLTNFITTESIIYFNQGLSVISQRGFEKLKNKMITVFIAVFILLIWMRPVSAKDVESLVEIQIGIFNSHKSAMTFAQKAASQLQYSLAEDIESIDPKKIRYIGSVVDIHRDQQQKFVVSAYLADSSHGKTSLNYYETYIKKYFPTAKRVNVEISHTDIGYNQGFIAYSVENVIILGSYKKYSDALKKGQEISAVLGVPFTRCDHVYDPKKGLILPEDSDSPHAGYYLARRPGDCCENNMCLSIERSDYYQDFSPGYYIIVGGLYPVDEANKTNLIQMMKKYKQQVPDAYYKKTPIYMGCRS